VSSSEALDVLYWAMHPASYRCIAMAIKIASNLPAFFVAVDSLLLTTNLNNIVIINIDYIRDITVCVRMLLVYSYCLGACHLQWMPFWSPFVTVGEQFVKKTGSSTFKLITPFNDLY